MMIAAVGRWILIRVRNFFYALGFFFEASKETLLFVKKRQVGFNVLVMQILFTGVEALTIIAVLSLSIGAVLIIQGVSLLPQFGQGKLIYAILITIITRELGPILTAFIIIARSGTAITTEIGNMVISHEIEAYMSIGINPISYIVVPRILGVTFSLILLNIYFNCFGLVGSFFITQFVNPIPITEYFSSLLYHLHAVDILSSFVKSLVFGIIISIAATFNGFKVGAASTEIPKYVIRSVGQSVILCIVANALITLVYYL